MIIVAHGEVMRIAIGNMFFEKPKTIVVKSPYWASKGEILSMDRELDSINGKPFLRNPSSANWKNKLPTESSSKKSKVAYSGYPAVRLSGFEWKADGTDKAEKERV